MNFQKYLVDHQINEGREFKKLNEAISYKDQVKALDLILKYLNGKIGPLYALPGFETVKKKDGMYIGIHYINADGNSLRFNWTVKEKDSSSIHSVDFYPPEKMFAAPEVTLNCNGDSLARLLPAVVEIFKTMNPNINLDKFVTENVNYTLNEAEKRTRASVEKAQMEKLIQKGLVKAVEKFDDTPYADPDTIFEDIEAYVQMVVKRIQPSLIVAGGPGIGKCLLGDTKLEIFTNEPVNMKNKFKSTINAEQLFKDISEQENHTFVVNEFYEPRREMFVKDENGDFTQITQMIIKKDNIFEVELEDGYNFKAGSFHYVNTNLGNVRLNVLDPNVHKIKVKDSFIKVKKVTDLNYEEIVYDISVESEKMLFQDAHGATHHNTYNITQTIKKAGLKEIEPMEMPDDVSAEDLAELGYDFGEESDGDWVHIKGASSAFGMYSNLYKYKNKLICFDDCDSVFQDKDGVNILKGALDSSDKRVISWISKSTTGKNAVVPPRFNFKGQIIFISNLPMEKIDSAIRNRSFVVDVKLKQEDVLKRIQTILPHIGKELDMPLTLESKERAFEFLKEAANDPNNTMEISIRTLVNFAKIAASGVPQWKRLMAIQAKNI